MNYPKSKLKYLRIKIFYSITMKRQLLTLVLAFFACVAIAQTPKAPTEAQRLTAQANPTLTPAQRDAIELVEYYGLHGDQVQKVKDIQILKYQNLAQIEPLRKTDLKLYIAKRQTTYDMAEMTMLQVLEDGHLEKYKAREQARLFKRQNHTDILRKQGLNDDEIERSYANFEF